ncbi:MAG: Uma2 family endonuclease [Microscillaceae bacterium]|nr:Uma2 family endonuclease [Microscillaceae bacterium]
MHQEEAKRRQFYNDITEEHKVEFINGEIIVHSPVKKRHNRATGLLYKLIDTYVQKHQLGFVGIEKIMIRLLRNDYEPDICFFKTEKAKDFTEDQTLFPAPDLVVEVLSESTQERDRGIKFEDYEAHQVGEYWLIDPEKQFVEQYQLINQKYELIFKAKTGTLKSVMLDNFEIPIAAIFDEVINLQTLTALRQ